MEDRHNIALIGFRTTGKSLVGRILAQELQWSFMDMDAELIASFGCDIATWVKTHGWELFRDAESKLLETLALHRRMVLATGGGVVLRHVNRRVLKAHFRVVWLQAAPETIHARMLQDPGTPANRPSLTELTPREEIRCLLQDRRPLYAEIADLALSTESTPPEGVSTRIREWMAAITPRH